jgi:hypothetical protein
VHDLSEAWLRHRRAGEHLADLEGLIDALSEQGDVVVPYLDPNARKDLVQLPPSSVPGKTPSVRVGEVVYNLRAALDYAVHLLSGRKRDSQFPVENDKNWFHARKTGRLPNGKRIKAFLKGVPPGCCDLIEAVQPCKGVRWTKRLATLSNEDKHRELTVLNAVSRKPFTRADFPALYPSPNLYPGPNVFPSAGYVKMHVDEPFEVALPDGTPVAEALQELKTQVGDLLKRLESCK